MTTFLLIRHGAHLLGGDTIAGRGPDVHLSPLGQEQARRMAEQVVAASARVAAIYCSPMERTLETAQFLSDRLALPVRVLEALNEIDFGHWSGCGLDRLRRQEAFLQWNGFRSGVCIPGGESMLQVQTRFVAEMLRLRDEHPHGCIALVSHGDPIKAAVAYFLGVPLDLFTRLEIGLASVSVVAIAEGGPWVLCVNNTGGLPLG